MAFRRQLLAEPKGARPAWKILDSADQFVAVPFVESASLKVVGKVHGLTTSTPHRLGFSGGKEFSRKTTTSEAWVYPETLQLTTVTPGPTADPGYNRLTIANENRQLFFFTESHSGGRLPTDLHLQELNVEGIWVVLDVKVHRHCLSDADDLFDQRDVVKIRSIRFDLAFSKIGHGGARQLDVSSCCLQFGALVEDERARMVGFD